MRGGDNDLDTDTIYGLVVLSFFFIFLMSNTTIAEINNKLENHERRNNNNNKGGKGNSQFYDILFKLKDLKDNELDTFIDKIFEKMENDGMSYQEYYKKSKDHIKKLIQTSENIGSIETMMMFTIDNMKNMIMNAK